ncbi:unnamed protein product [Mytilus edulis]|uniref:Uncharacterized protein n=1 Tax=Mytilus edulis TaxID=6550 RepID=A0A8S3QHF1_MYTED|nr:unnamed protein product [Mytilus edulis]
MSKESLDIGIGVRRKPREDWNLQAFETLKLTNQDVICVSSTVLTSEKEIVNEKGKDSNKSTGQKKDITCASSTVLTSEKEIVNEKAKTVISRKDKKDDTCESSTVITIEKGKTVISRQKKKEGLLSGQATKTGDANELNSPHHREREKRDTSTVNWKIVNPVLKIGAPLCISFQGETTQCTVHFDNKTIGSDADQYGSTRVYANGKKCILCIHNFHLANHTINRPIQVDSDLHRIATTSLQDILKEGLVVYGTVIHEDNTVELIFSQIGQQAHCFYEDNSKINVTAGRIQLIYDHNQTVNLTHKRILFDRSNLLAKKKKQGNDTKYGLPAHNDPIRICYIPLEMNKLQDVLNHVDIIDYAYCSVKHHQSCSKQIIDRQGYI